MPAARPPFAPSPRRMPAATLGSAARTLGALHACFRRAAACPRLYTQNNRRLWRWLCMPAGVPLVEEG